MLGRLAAVAATGMLALAGSASAAITPGVQTYTDGGQCTANFVFQDAADVYVGQAAHCAGTDGNTATNGCDAGSLPLGTPVEVGGATRPGTLAYSSWLTMQGNGEDDADTCEFNDFAHARQRRPAGAARQRHGAVPRPVAPASVGVRRFPVAARLPRARGGRRTRGRA